MKPTIKFFVIIAMVAVIAFSMAACGGSGDKDKKADKTTTESGTTDQEQKSTSDGVYSPADYQRPQGDRGGDDYDPPERHSTM